MTSFGIQQVGQICRIPCIGTISGFSVWFGFVMHYDALVNSLGRGIPMLFLLI
jgi:hypothetical protein